MTDVLKIIVALAFIATVAFAETPAVGEPADLTATLFTGEAHWRSIGSG